jgi:hypothetical protein
MDDLHVLTTREASQRLLEAPLADVTPGADQVRPDIDAHLRSIAGRSLPIGV